MAALCIRCGHYICCYAMFNMVALWNSADHYIFILWFLTLYFCPVVSSFFLLLSSFFPRLISAFADWMSTILAHMVWPYCKFKMQVWNLLHGARWKYRTQKVTKISPSGHHRRTLSGCILATRHVSTIGKNMFPQYGELRSTSGWDRSGSLGHPFRFQRLLHWMSTILPVMVWP